ncbi:MAG: hypothetical protein KKA19_04340 [Candidatus Margulisbacteria bacterium]|nr:hypothetical protein [Candidatus Margulisiibacteriota bacterium]
MISSLTYKKYYGKKCKKLRYKYMRRYNLKIIANIFYGFKVREKSIAWQLAKMTIALERKMNTLTYLANPELAKKYVDEARSLIFLMEDDNKYKERLENLIDIILNARIDINKYQALCNRADQEYSPQKWNKAMCKLLEDLQK